MTAAIHYAASIGNRPLLVALLTAGADIESLDSGICQFTPLLCAVNNQMSGAVTELLARGANVEARDVVGFTALHIAAINSDWRCVQILLVRGDADINAKSIGMATALHHAAAVGCVRVVKILLEKGADKYAADSSGFVPAMMVKRKAVDREELLDLLE
ncbi:hypothetical protein Q9L58_006949 [Maublancomyces gigas]|uniref:Ankyrin repeat protein n=1 Tax=Discina gigas TaxID=1032678 RepID=A0ABR3GDV2_9PEZI